MWLWKSFLLQNFCIKQTFESHKDVTTHCILRVEAIRATSSQLLILMIAMHHQLVG